jgi:hypothetical protein
LKVHASAIIYSHNHPSSILRPSQKDIRLTKKLKEACELLDISFLDHIIMTEEDHYSFANEGLLLPFFIEIKSYPASFMVKSSHRQSFHRSG